MDVIVFIFGGSALVYFMGIDIGGTKIEAALFSGASDPNTDWEYKAKTDLFSLHYKLLNRGRISTGRQNGYHQAAERLKDLCQKLIADSGLDITELNSIGIGMPGPIDPVTKLMITGNSGIFIDKDIKNDLAASLPGFEGKIFCENDANCFTLAEAVSGAAAEIPQTGAAQIVAGIILGTGVGGGVYRNGKLDPGRRGGASEWGHIPFKSNGFPCYCGNQGCVEQYLSGPALEALFSQRLYSQIENRPDSREIFELSESKDPVAMAVVKQYKRDLGSFLATLTQVLDPDIFVLGGGVSLQPEIYEGITEIMNPYLFVKESPPRVVPHMLGDSAGVIGAALLPFVDGGSDQL